MYIKRSLRIGNQKYDTVKRKVVFLDLLIVFPLCVLLSIIIFLTFWDSNKKLNESRLELLNGKSDLIAEKNVEIVKITSALNTDPEINRILSKRTLADYEYIQADNIIQKKMRELTAMFPERQYQILLLCDNGNNYFQSSLGFHKNIIEKSELEKETWYQEIEKEKELIFYLPQYRSEILGEIFKDDVMFAVRSIRNMNTGRVLGTMIVAISQNIWEKNVFRMENPEDKIILADQFRRIIYSSDIKQYGKETVNSVDYNKIDGYKEGFFQGEIADKVYHITFTDIENTHWKLISYCSPGQVHMTIYIFSVLVLVMIIAAVITLLVFYNCNFISKRMYSINKNISEISEGSVKKRIEDSYEAEFQDICRSVNSMLDYIEELMSKLKEEKQEKLAVELQALQARISPHFLYNTLTVIRLMVQMDEYEKADHALLAFSKLLRKSFTNSKSVVSIREELDMTRDYLELMENCYRKKFEWKIVTGIDPDKFSILKHVIQPLVENSIFHGFHMKEGIGHIVIRVYQIKDLILAEVEDDGLGADIEEINQRIQANNEKKEKDRYNGIGLSNVHMRIVSNYGEKYGLQAERNETGGITFRMRIPAIEQGGADDKHSSCG